ncbi:GNAT family N-acetyltransferase [Symbioplanes lichenis]|uniref:GNAT family N-acetyltransferase n=1 Tax=Symbioplanes lichenis TaxID=1629072 RepID=UPI002739F489|nr:GNAT family N-acetyltransferase [Actinoplanes lichenis]
MDIRKADAGDAAAVVALRSVVYPYLVRGVEATRQGMTGAEWVAEAGGRVVGWVAARGRTVSLLHVHPEHRGHGLGGALLDVALAHVEEPARAFATTESLGFARRHGFRPSREVRYSALDLTGFATVRSDMPRLRDVDPVELHRTYTEATADEPGDVPATPVPFERFVSWFWENPDADREAGSVAFADGRPVAFSLVLRDGDRVWSDMTATLPAYRGRGLAYQVKRAALSRARGRTAFTSNDEANKPMLAINARLGYRTIAAQWSCVRAS